MNLQATSYAQIEHLVHETWEGQDRKQPLGFPKGIMIKLCPSNFFL